MEPGCVERPHNTPIFIAERDWRRCRWDGTGVLREEGDAFYHRVFEEESPYLLRVQGFPRLCSRKTTFHQSLSVLTIVVGRW